MMKFISKYQVAIFGCFMFTLLGIAVTFSVNQPQPRYNTGSFLQDKENCFKDGGVEYQTGSAYGGHHVCVFRKDPE